MAGLPGTMSGTRRQGCPRIEGLIERQLLSRTEEVIGAELKKAARVPSESRERLELERWRIGLERTVRTQIAGSDLERVSHSRHLSTPPVEALHLHRVVSWRLVARKTSAKTTPDRFILMA